MKIKDKVLKDRGDKCSFYPCNNIASVCFECHGRVVKDFCVEERRETLAEVRKEIGKCEAITIDNDNHLNWWIKKKELLKKIGDGK